MLDCYKSSMSVWVIHSNIITILFQFYQHDRCIHANAYKCAKAVSTLMPRNKQTNKWSFFRFNFVTKLDLIFIICIKMNQSCAYTLNMWVFDVIGPNIRATITKHNMLEWIYLFAMICQVITFTVIGFIECDSWP